MQSLCLRWAWVLKTKQCSGLMLRGNLYLLSLLAGRHLCLCSPQWGSLDLLQCWGQHQTDLAPLSVSKPSGLVFDSCMTLPGGSRAVLSSKHLVVTSGLWLRGDSRKPPGSATGQFPIFFHFRSITPQKQPATPNLNSMGKASKHK